MPFYGLHTRKELFMKKNKEQSSCPFSDRLGKVGGQAVLEGVMMKAGNRMVTTCRRHAMRYGHITNMMSLVRELCHKL